MMLHLWGTNVLAFPIRGPCLRGHYLFWSSELLELNSELQTTNMKQKSLRDQHILLEPLIRFLHSAKHVQPSFPVFLSDDKGAAEDKQKEAESIPPFTT